VATILTGLEETGSVADVHWAFLEYVLEEPCKKTSTEKKKSSLRGAIDTWILTYRGTELLTGLLYFLDKVHLMKSTRFVISACYSHVLV